MVATLLFIGICIAAIMGEVEALAKQHLPLRVGQIIRFANIRRRWPIMTLLVIACVYSASELWMTWHGEIGLRPFPWQLWGRMGLFLAAGAILLAYKLSAVKAETKHREQIAIAALLVLMFVLTYI